MKRITKVLLSSIFCLSTLVGCSSSPYAKAEAQTLTVQGVPVYVEPDENTAKNDVDTFLRYLNKQPDYLIRKCTKIYLQGEIHIILTLRIMKQDNRQSVMRTQKTIAYTCLLIILKLLTT